MSGLRLRLRHLAGIALPLAVLFLSVAQVAPIHAASDAPYKLPRNLLGYFQSKYGLVDDDLISTVQERPDGPLGVLSLRGHILPPGAPSATSFEERARGVARAFLAAEAGVLGLHDLNEIVERKLAVEEERVVIQYSREIGGIEVTGSLIRVDVGRDGGITRVEAGLTPSPPGLYAAARREPKRASEVRAIVVNDLRAPDDPPPTVSEPILAARWQPPYVIYAVSGAAAGKAHWNYAIDAFTGEILSRTCSAETLVRADHRSPCD